MDAHTNKWSFSCLTKRTWRCEGGDQESGRSEATPGMTKRNPGGWTSMPFIIGNETFERLASFGLLANFMVYLKREYHMDQVSASNLINIWSGVTNFAPLFGAFLSDAYFGRFRTIAFGSFAAFVGMLTMTLTAWEPNLRPPKCQIQDQPNNCMGPNTNQVGMLLLSLGFLSIGTGGIRPCSIPFGVDQFDHTTDEGRRGINSYYNWYYTTFTVVVMITSTIVVYIQDSVSWVWGFAVPALLMLFSIVLFFLGTKLYVYVKPEGSIFLDIAQVFVAAYRKRRLELPDEGKQEVFYEPPIIEGTLATKLPLTNQCRWLNKAAIVLDGEVNPDGSCSNKWNLSTVQKIEEVKCLLKVLPIWATGIICFTAVAQQGTFIVSQAMAMDRHIARHSNFQIPPGSISVVSMLTVGIWVPIYDRFIVPKLRRITKHEEGITLLQRMGIGLVFSIMSMVVAGLVEQRRRNSANSHPECKGIAPMSVFWLTPQLVLLGFAEAFNFIGQIEFYNKQFPENMRSIGTALFFVTISGANYLSSLVVNMVHGLTGGHGGRPDWLTNDINRGRVDYFYYLLAGMGVVNFVYFVVCARKYRYKIMVQVDDEEKSYMDMDPPSLK